MDAPRTASPAPATTRPPRIDARELLGRYLAIVNDALERHRTASTWRARLESLLANGHGRTFYVVVFDGTPDTVRGTYAVRLCEGRLTVSDAPLVAAPGAPRSAWYVSEAHLRHVVHKPAESLVADPERLDLDWLQ